MTSLRMHLRRLMQGAAILACALLVALVLSEFIVRAVMPQQLIVFRPDIWGPVDTVGWALRPNIRTTINTGERTVSVISDSNGFRVGAAERPDADVHVLLLGDSFMEALQVEYEQSVAGLLEADLSRQLGRNVRVHNAGVSGWEPSQYFLKMRQELSGRRYDAIVVSIFAGNDAIAGRSEYFSPRPATVPNNFRLPRAMSRAEIISGLAYPLNDALERRSHLFILAKRQARTVLMRLGLSYFVLPPEVLRSEAGSQRWSMSAEVFRDMQEAARAADVPIVFVLIPSDYQVDPAVLAEYVRAFGLDPALVDAEQPTRRFVESLGGQDVEVLDLLPFLRGASARGSRMYGSHDYHFSPEGHRVMAGVVSPLILNALGSIPFGSPATLVSGGRPGNPGSAEATAAH